MALNSFKGIQRFIPHMLLHDMFTNEWRNEEVRLEVRVMEDPCAFPLRMYTPHRHTRVKATVLWECVYLQITLPQLYDISDPVDIEAEQPDTVHRVIMHPHCTFVRRGQNFTFRNTGVDSLGMFVIGYYSV